MDEDLREMGLAKLRELADTNNDPAAQTELAWRYIDGDEKENLLPDPREGAKYAQRAATQEHIPGELLYAHVLENGLAGQSNIAEAFMLYAKVLLSDPRALNQGTIFVARLHIDDELRDTFKIEQPELNDVTFTFPDETRLNVITTMVPGKARACFSALLYLCANKDRPGDIGRMAREARMVVSGVLGTEPKTVERSADDRKMIVTFDPVIDVLTLERFDRPMAHSLSKLVQ